MVSSKDGLSLLQETAGPFPLSISISISTQTHCYSESHFSVIVTRTVTSRPIVTRHRLRYVFHYIALTFVFVLRDVTLDVDVEPAR